MAYEPGRAEADAMRMAVLHYANLIYAERQRAEKLQRQLDCARARIEMLEETAYGGAFL